MLHAFARGVRQLGYDPLVLDVNNYQPVDIAVVFGVGKKGVPVSWPRANVIFQQRRQCKPVIIIEKGFVKRDQYYMVGFNGLNHNAAFFNEGSPSDRWEALGVELKPWRYDGEHILVCGQVPSDASVQDIDIIHWSAEITSFLRKHTDKKVVYRPHPLARNRTPHMMGVENSNRDLATDLSRACAVVTYNSNTAVEAVIEGIPSFAMDKGSMAWEVACHDINRINDYAAPMEVIRTQWAYNLAYTQWNEAEFMEGLPFQHLVTKVKEMGE